MNEYQVHIDNIFDLSDEEFFNLCVKNEKLRFERFDGDVYIMSPTGSRISQINSKLNFHINKWAFDKNLVVFDSSGGFQLDKKVVLSPDLAIIKKEKWDSLDNDSKIRFAPITPDFIAEIVSPSDSIHYAEKKIKKWLEYGVKLAWLIIPQEERIIVYFEGNIQEFTANKNVPGYDILPEIEFKLKEIL